MKNLKSSLTVILFLFGISIFAQNSQEVINSLKQETGAIVTINENHNIAEFVKFPYDRSLSLQGSSAEDKATTFLNQYKSIYNLTSVNSSLEFMEVKTDNYGLKNLTLKQLHNGVPVFDAELRFHFNSEEKLTAINGNFIPFIKVNSTPTLSDSAANSIALEIIENQNINYSGKALTIFSSKLFVFQKGLIQGYNGGNHLVYEVEIRNEFDVREFLYIDAHNGSLVEQFTGMAHAIDRVVYEGDTSTLVWEEGDAFPGSLDIWQQNEVMASGHTYNFFNNAFGYASFDGADAQMITINNLNVSGFCPNARWTGSQAQYCSGTATDDIIGHEWGHAYTQYTSSLIYAWQSGAINESYSDIWGETIDLLNNYEDEGEDISLRTGCNSSVRWRQGEDATGFGGAIRDMWDPTCDGDPGKVTDGQYWCSTGDNGGVHINSGIPNHAYALLVDGGTYNGQTISGIGFTKAAHIFWRAQSVYLSATSDFTTLADALEASCTDLFGINLEGLSTSETPAGASGEVLSSHDLTQVTNAILAVELRVNPDSCGFTTLLNSSDDLCEASTSNPLFYEDWESGIGDWTVEQVPTNPDTWTSRDWEINNSLPNRTGNAMFAVDPINGDCGSDLENGIIRLDSPEINIPNITTGDFELSFNHYVTTETGWDGGNLKYKLPGTRWFIIPASSFTTNPYNSSLQTTDDGNDNPLAGQDAFTGSDGGSNNGSWGQSTINLSSLGIMPDSTIQLRWELGTDGCNGTDVGWFVDEIIIYNCSAALSVNEFDQMLEGVEIYPNPTNGIITLQKTNEINLLNAKLYDINGRLLKNVDLSNMISEKEINISKLASGIYIISVQSDTNSGVMRLVKN